jgi:hypothetical protein
VELQPPSASHSNCAACSATAPQHSTSIQHSCAVTHVASARSLSK